MRLLLRLLKWIGITLTAVIVVLAAYVYRTWDRVWDVALPDVHASTDPAVIARGEYFVYGPAHCVECHTASAEVFEHYAETGERPPLIGGVAFPAPPLGTIYSRNLTPDPETGIGRFSDGQIARMLRYAVKPDGRASIRPLMEYADMSDEDIAAIISFLRAQPPVRHAVPNAKWTLVGKIIKSLAPTFKPRTPDLVHAQKTPPPPSPTRQRGEYLVRGVGNCSGCHSPLDQLTFSLNGPEFSGGAAIEPRGIADVDHAMWFQPPNLTPLAGSALLRFPDRETFVARFQKGGRKYRGSLMPWDCYRNMTTEDAAAVYEFLHSLPATGKASPQEPTVRHE